jgi:hypothetical protein
MSVLLGVLVTCSIALLIMWVAYAPPRAKDHVYSPRVIVPQPIPCVPVFLRKSPKSGFTALLPPDAAQQRLLPTGLRGRVPRALEGEPGADHGL